MQGQRDVMELDQGSNSSNSSVDPQVYLSNTEPGMPFVNTVTTSPERESFRGWNFSEPESSGYGGNPIDLEQPKRDCEWNSIPVSNSSTSSRPHGSFEPRIMVQLENVNEEIYCNNNKNTQITNLDFFGLHQNSMYNPNPEFDNTNGNSNSQASESDARHLFNSFGSDTHIIQSVTDSRNSWAASAAENRFHLPENTDGRLRDSLVGQCVCGKRKIHEGASEQSSTSGSLKHLLKGESSEQGFSTGNSSWNSGGLGLNILDPSSNPAAKGANPSFDGDTRAGISVSAMENVTRNDRRRINPSHDGQDITLNTSFWTPSNSHMHPNSWQHIQPSSYTGPYVQVPEVRPPTPVSLQPNQAKSTVPKNSLMPQNTNPFPWNKALSSPSVSRERYPSRHVMCNVPVPLIDARFQRQDPTNWDLFTRNVSPSSLSPSSDVVGSLLGSAPPTPWPPLQIRPHQLRSSDLARCTVASSGSDSGVQSRDVRVQDPSQFSAAHEIAPNLAIGSRCQQRILRSAFLMERLNDFFGVPFPHRIAALRDGQGGRMVSEQIRNALDGICRGDILRGFESMLFGGAELHDRYRDMRLDVDNMSYEELLALEDRIGNVSTGLSEETIMKHLKLQKYKSSSEDVDVEPCCICQEEYVEGDDLGVLDCGHDFHSDCIKKWVSQKNLCPVCKTTGLVI